MTRISTPDLADEHPGVRALELQLRTFGKRRRFGGPVTTIKCFEDNSLVKEAVSEPGAGRVIVVDGGGSLRRALLGDMLAAAAEKNGWMGLVINGAVRDVDEIGEIDLGIQALGTCPVRSDKRGAGERDVPIRVGGADIVPGDYLYADDNGVIISGKPLVTL
jgi:regulator of ribonuclease activity A